MLVRVTLTLTLPPENIFFLYSLGGHLYSCRNYHSPADYGESRGVGSIRYHRGTVGYHRVPLAEDIIGGLEGIIEYHGQRVS